MTNRAMQEMDSRNYPIREDMPFQRRSWIAERVGWVVMGLLVVVALSGFFALGPLSRANVAAPDGRLAVDYQRFAHKTARTWFTIRGPRDGGEMVVRLSPAFAATHDIESMDPRPARSSGGPHGLEFAYAPSSTGDFEIHIGARPKRFGFAQISVEAQDRGKVEFTQFVYP